MKILKKIMIVFVLLVAMLTIGTFLFMKQAVFGNDPSDKQLERIVKSPNYKDGRFQNLHDTPMMAPDVSYWKMFIEFFFTKPSSTEPDITIPYVQTDLKASLGDKPAIIWFGHSSYLIKINGKNFLMDPVFSGNASPVSFVAKSYPGSNVYQAEDFPDLDGILISHDHYDHLDYKTIMKLNERTKHFYVPLGVGSHLMHWGVDENKISEFDWWEGVDLGDSMQITATPARHFSGRGFGRFKSLWASYVISSSTYRLYLGGDSGYDDHFKAIGDKYGPFDIAFLECGQYNWKWPFIHMMPEQTVQASIDLKARVLMPVHWGKFTLSVHPWNESAERATKAADSLNVKLTTPRIGEPIFLDVSYPNESWWRK
jgi:L-ascorbate metabolism protein UlaG (beta-lactamase superfamily)